MATPVGPRAQRCPACAAVLAAGAAWCSLCLARVAPLEPEPPRLAPAGASSESPSDVDGTPTPGTDGLVTGVDADVAVDGTTVAGSTDALLAELAAAEQARRPVWAQGGLSGGARTALALGGMAAMTAVGVLVLAIASLVL